MGANWCLRSDLVTNSRLQVGGLSTCHDGWYLLDAEQELPWPDQPISYYMKVRLYYQEFSPSTPETAVAAAKPASHVNAFDITWSIAGATGEYDVPRCAPGTPTEKCACLCLCRDVRA